ncbi:MAG: ankyrin repeat domain-containing protein [Candidatus Micrarchaeota archaeon]|nr:ankyrin repeat domain-containing protein [Candidatus Micrarchaeota archaeon]
MAIPKQASLKKRHREYEGYNGFKKANPIEEPAIKEGASRRTRALDRLLLQACKEWDLDKVKKALAKGASPNAKDSQLKTALMWAVYEENYEIASVLILHGADVNAKDKFGQTALMAAVEMQNVRIAELLLKNNACVHEKSSYGWTALMWAKEKENDELIQMLFGYGATE